MKILLTGASGFIGKRLIPSLLKEGHELVLLLRINSSRSPFEIYKDKVSIIYGDLLDKESLSFPKEIDVAFYLVHSMSQSREDFDKLEEQAAYNFIEALKKTNCRQIIYLSGLAHAPHLSKHLLSRLHVENILKESGFHFTGFRAGIVIGAGSASFEIIRDLVEKLPLMVAPKWIHNKCQPIASTDVVYYLTHAIGNKGCYDRIFDIGGPDVLTFKQMMLQFAEVRHLKRFILTVPVLTPHLSSYWLVLVTAVNYSLASSLVDSLKNDAVCRDHSIQELIPRKCLSYKAALQRAFAKIEDNAVVSSWMDAWNIEKISPDLNDYIQISKEGCFLWQEKRNFEGDIKPVIERIFSIGGQNGWYSMNWIWNLRGLIDKVLGGVGIRRGRRDPKELHTGDALDFWRVLVADKNKGRLLLYAEMKLPGEGWIEWKIDHHGPNPTLIQTTTFRPQGVLGRIYWIILYPFHFFIFRGMIKGLLQDVKIK